MKTRFNKLRLASVVSAVVMLSGMTSVNAADFTVAKAQPRTVVELTGSVGSSYIVRLTDPPVATYDGGIAGYAATSATATGKQRLDTNSKAAKKYAKHLERKQGELLEQAAGKFGRSLTTKFDYQQAVNGFALELTIDEAKAMSRMAGVAAVQRERMEHLLTDSGPAWIGAPDLWSNGSNSTQGEGMVVAILDTGINSDHPSFAATGDDGYTHTNPLGSGNYLPGSYCIANPDFCNDKLIGAHSFVAEAVTPEDSDGHGSHTASTTAGNVVYGATLDAPTTSVSFDVTGVAPHANIIAYDVCVAGCPGAALVAAMEQVLIDSSILPNGIAALNYSISGGGNPYNDAVELAFLSAVEAGIYVAASAGNSGPGASTVAHLGPWVSTTGASTHNRQIRNSVTDLNSGGGGTPDISGLGLTGGYGPAPIVNSADYEGDPGLKPGTLPGEATLCGRGAIGNFNSPFPAGFFNGEIVACTRGTFGRTEKGSNVLDGGAGGFVLMDNGGGLVGDAHVLPGVHISQADGAILGPWITANSGNSPMATISGFNVDLSDSNGDVMAGFSSRGPGLAFDVLKPDVTAPGVDIFAAEADGGTTENPNQFLSGTSMSSPHNAGAGALMAASRPDWTPQEIKSAIMMTATTANTVKEDGVTPTDAFDLGAGRIVLGDAVNAGLVLNETIANFEAANPSLGGDPSTLNLASMMDSSCVGTCSWTRTVTNKMKNTGHWNVTVDGSGFDTEVTVSPQANSADYNLKLKKGQSGTITVTATNYNSADGWQFGTVNLDRNKDDGPDLHMPMAVFASKASNANLFTKSVDNATAADGDTLTYALNVTNGPLTGPVTVTDVVPAGTAFVSGSETEVVTNGSTTSPWTYDGGSNSLSWTGELGGSGIAIAPSPLFGFVPLSAFGIPATPAPGGCDEGGYLISGLDINYNGVNYTDAIWSVNGTLELGQASGSTTGFINAFMPDPATPNNLLAPLWGDMFLCAGGTWTIGALASGPTVWDIFEWNSVPEWPGVGANSFQIWLERGTSNITYTYGATSASASFATVGAENADGTVGDTWFFDGAGADPSNGPDLGVIGTPGGTATLGFQVTTDCSEDTIVNEGNLSSGATNENAIAVTTCP